MMNLEPRQLGSGHYMQGIQLRLDNLTPVFERLRELMLLPRAMRWLGEASFELAVLSELRDGQVRLHRYLNLRLRVDPSAKAALREGLNRAAEDLRKWLRTIEAGFVTALGDNESLLGKMPDDGYCFVTKSLHAGANAYEKVILPIDSDCGVDLSAIQAILCRYPGCGVSLQLTPDIWRKAEKEQIERFGRGSGVAEERWKTLLTGDIAAFTCAVWGSGSEAVLDTIINAGGTRFSRAAEIRDGRGIADLLACDPWAIHTRLCGRSRFRGVFSADELQRLFCFGELEINLNPVTDIPAHSEAIMEMLRQMLDAQRQETEESFRKELSRTQGKLEEMVSQSETKTRSVLRDEMESAIERSRQEIIAEIRSQTQTLSQMLEEVSSDVSDLRGKQAKLQDLLENKLLLTGEQLKEFVHLLERMTGERDKLRRELLDLTVQGADRPLSSKMLNMLGVESEKELLDGGMTEKQLTILRIAMACLEGKPILNDGDKNRDETDYHAYVLYLGFLYEQMMRAHYHNGLYLPYFRYRMPAGTALPDVDNTDLYCYDKGPEAVRGYRSMDWKDDVMARSFSEYVTLAGEKKPREYWNAMFIRMRLARLARNQMHSNTIDTHKTYSYVEFMLKNSGAYPCLIWMILKAGRAESAFPVDND